MIVNLPNPTSTQPTPVGSASRRELLLLVCTTLLLVYKNVRFQFGCKHSRVHVDVVRQPCERKSMLVC